MVLLLMIVRNRLTSTATDTMDKARNSSITRRSRSPKFLSPLTKENMDEFRAEKLFVNKLSNLSRQSEQGRSALVSRRGRESDVVSEPLSRRQLPLMAGRPR
jgi:hypothetical protein